MFRVVSVSPEKYVVSSPITKVSVTSTHSSFPALYSQWYITVPSAVNDPVNDAFPPAISVSFAGIVLGTAADPTSSKSMIPLSSKSSSGGWYPPFPITVPTEVTSKGDVPRYPSSSSSVYPASTAS